MAGKESEYACMLWSNNYNFKCNKKQIKKRIFKCACSMTRVIEYMGIHNQLYIKCVTQLNLAKKKTEIKCSVARLYVFR